MYYMIRKKYTEEEIKKKEIKVALKTVEFNQVYRKVYTQEDGLDVLPNLIPITGSPGSY